MTNFAYQARDHSGQLVTGTLAAESIAEVGKQLRAEGKFPVKVSKATEAVETDQQYSIAHATKYVKRDDVINFTHQLAVMVDAGVNIGETLEAICEQTDKEHFKVILDDITQAVQGGECLSKALGKHPRIFPNVMISLIRASEATGTMGQMLERISGYLTKERDIIKTLRGALMYPMIMMFVCLSVTVFLLTFVLPRFATIYSNRGAILPAPTRILMGASNFLITYWYLILAFIIVSIIGFIYFKKTEFGRRSLDQFKLSCPILRNIFSHLYVSRSMRTMGTMINAGVPMLDLVQITREVTDNVLYRDLWDEVDRQLKQGAQLSTPLGESNLIPKSVSRMICAGEKSGQLSKVMTKVADFTEGDFDRAIKQATVLIEPIMITFMGSFIGFVVISLLLPIFSVGRVMSGQ